MIQKCDWESNPVNPPSYWRNTTKITIHPFVLVYLTKVLCPPPIQSPTIDDECNKKTMSCTIKTIHKMDDRAWIREDTLIMLLTTARLMHLQQSQG